MTGSAAALLVPLLVQSAAVDEARAVISGRVVSAETGEGLRGARVILSSQQRGEKFARTSLTGPDGAYSLDRLPPGSYILTVHKYGYRPAAGLPLRLTLLSKQERTGLDLKMHRPGVVAGTVRDADGRPVAGAQVTAYRLAWLDGLRRVLPAQTARSDDRGAYRLFGLEPGRYLIGAVAPLPEHPEGELEWNSSAYYAEAGRISDATPLAVAWGRVVEGIDLVIRRGPGFAVSGRVVDATTGRPCSPCTIRVAPLLEPEAAEIRSARAAPDGAYRIRGLPPDSYRITAEKPGAAGIAARRIDIVNRGLEGVDLAVGLERVLFGRVVFETPPPDQFKPASVQLELRDLTGQAERVPVQPDASFAARDLAPGIYRIVPGGLPPGCYLKSIRLGGRELSSPELELPDSGSVGPVELVVALDGAGLSGTVQPNAREQRTALEGAAIVLFPQPGQPGYVQESRIPVQPGGSFEVQGLFPGRYTAFALPGTAAPPIEDPEVRPRYEAFGKNVTLERGRTAAIELVLVPSSEEP